MLRVLLLIIGYENDRAVGLYRIIVIKTVEGCYLLYALNCIAGHHLLAFFSLIVSLHLLDVCSQDSAEGSHG